MMERSAGSCLGGLWSVPSFAGVRRGEGWSALLCGGDLFRVRGGIASRLDST